MPHLKDVYGVTVYHSTPVENTDLFFFNVIKKNILFYLCLICIYVNIYIYKKNINIIFTKYLGKIIKVKLYSRYTGISIEIKQIVKL